jgi:hypothetical protein
MPSSRRLFEAWTGEKGRTVCNVEFPHDLRRDQFAAFIVAERDAQLLGCGPIEVVRWPDSEDRSSEAVELIARDHHGRFIAVEHTVIESYPNQISDYKALEKVFPMGGPHLDDVPDAGQFQLILRTDEVSAIPWNRRRAVHDEVTAWTRSALHRAPWPHKPGSPTYVREVVGADRLEVSLARWTDEIGIVGPLSRVVTIGLWRPDDLEDRRNARLGASLHRKVPKLLAAYPGSRTILVLEDRDMSMSAPGFVSRALASAAGTDRLPDAIYHLNVTAGNPLLTALYSQGSWWHEQTHGTLLSFSEERATRFNGLE